MKTSAPTPTPAPEKKKKRFSWENLETMMGDKWEKNFIVMILILFVVLGLTFIVYVIPLLNPNFSLLQNRSGQGDAALEEEETDPAKIFSAGVKSSESMNYSAALTSFQKAVEKDPGNVTYLTELAHTHYQLKNYEEAIKTYDRLIEADGGNESSYSNSIGNIYNIRKEYERAEFYFRAAIEKNPKLSVAYNNLALMLQDEGKRDEAIAVLEEGIAKSDDREGLEATLHIVKGDE